MIEEIQKSFDTLFEKGYEEGYKKAKEDFARPHGVWVYHADWESDGECAYECSRCGMGYDVDYNFCPNCGADMRNTTSVVLCATKRSAFVARKSAMRRSGRKREKVIGMRFKVIDNKTGKEADPYEIALHEDWASGLCYCDMEGFALTEDGELLLMDECGQFRYCDTDRFKVVFEEEKSHGEWEYLKEHITELRDANGYATQYGTCQFILNLMGVIEEEGDRNETI